MSKLCVAWIQCSWNWCSFFQTRALVSVKAALHHAIKAWAASFDWQVASRFYLFWGGGGDTPSTMTAVQLILAAPLAEAAWPKNKQSVSSQIDPWTRSYRVLLVGPVVQLTSAKFLEIWGIMLLEKMTFLPASRKCLFWGNQNFCGHHLTLETFLTRNLIVHFLARCPSTLFMLSGRGTLNTNKSAGTAKDPKQQKRWKKWRCWNRAEHSPKSCLPLVISQNWHSQPVDENCRVVPNKEFEMNIHPLVRGRKTRKRKTPL